MADLLFYRLKYRSNSQSLVEEIVCARHYAEFSQPGRDMAPLGERERLRLEQTTKPYDGDRPCATCEEEAGRSVAV